MKKLSILLWFMGVLALVVLISFSNVGHAQEDSPEAVAAKLDAPLRLAFYIWNERVRLQGAQPTQPSAISPEIKMFESAASKLAQRVDLHLDSPEPGANVLVHTTDNARELEANGISVQARVGDLATAYIPFSRLLEVATLPSVVFVEASQILQPANDVSVPETGAPHVWSNYGVTGTGVIVGIIDSGIDPFHPDFIKPDGTTRIKYLLDFSDPGDSDSDGTLNGPIFGGTMYTETQINVALTNPGWFYRSADTPQVIPDGSLTGIASYIAVTQNVAITNVAVDLYIEHSNVGDLRVTLTCPSGTSVTLHDWAGGSRDNIIGTFTITACTGQNAIGTWRLTVSDYVSSNTGDLVFWKLHLNQPVRMTDQVGHGTHVAGTAAGNGQGTGGSLPAGTFKGMAPGADLIVVRGTRNYIGGLLDSDIVNALAFIDQKAQELGLPYVVNMSFGGQLGPHDGTSLEERAINNLVGSGKLGKAVVVSAGNEGDEDIHASGMVPRGGIKNVSFNVPSAPSGYYAVVANDIWYEGSDSFGIGYQRPDGYTRDRTINPGGNGVCYAPSDYSYIICVESSLNNPNNGDKEIYLLLLAIARHSGEWKFILHGDTALNGRFDAWLLGGVGAKFTSDVDASMRVEMPGTARNAITVGAYTTKNQWIDVTGVTHSITATVGAIADFSSDGPTRDGRQKPEITAPGQKICSTLSDQSSVGAYGSMYSTRADICQDGRHGIVQGTSMSAPHVTGAVALLLSLNRNLDAAQLKDLLTGHARSDSFTGAVPNNHWGYGKLDVLAAAQTTVPQMAQILGVVALQGRPGTPHPAWITSLEVSFYEPGSTNLLYKYQVTTDQSGHFNLNDIPPGNYDVRIKGSHTLANIKRNVALQPGSNTINFGTLLEGDANDDNCVTAPDFSILRTAFGQSQGQPGYDPRADFNQDGAVSAQDFSLLRTNFGRCGDVQVTTQGINKVDVSLVGPLEVKRQAEPLSVGLRLSQEAVTAHRQSDHPARELSRVRGDNL